MVAQRKRVGRKPDARERHLGLERERRLTREVVLELVMTRYVTQPFTTRDIARALEMAEHRARAAISWMLLGGIVERAGSVERRDREGRPYQATQYRWTGQDQIRQVARDPDERRRQAEGGMSQRELIKAFLGRRWGR